MATKLGQSSPADHRRPSAPKMSIFGTKAGFNETPTTSNEDSTRHVHSKTKWGPDLALDPVVGKGRALAYQTRVEQITKLLKSGTFDMGKIEVSMCNGEQSNSVGSDKENELGNVELLELERREIIGEILRLNPGYKVPENYKPILKETKIPLPAEAHPGHNIIGVFIGPESDTQKRLHESEIRHQDINAAQVAYEDLHINVSADSYDKIDAAVALIELLLAPVSNTTSQPGLLPYQTHNAPWLSTPQMDGPPIPSLGPGLSALPNKSFMPPYTSQPHTNSMPRNPFPVPGPLQSIPSNQQHSPYPQMTQSSLVTPPVRHLQIPHASGGWPSFSPVMSHSQRPLSGFSTGTAPRDMSRVRPISVSPLGASPPQGPTALPPPPNTHMYRGQHPPVANFTLATLLSGPPGGTQTFPTVAPQGPSSMTFPGGASTQSPYPLSIQVVSTPKQVRGPPPAFSQVGSNPGMVPHSIASSCPPAPIAALRPPCPIAGDFTFRPVVSPAPTLGSQMGTQGIHPGAPFFYPGNQNPNQGFQRPFDSRPMNMMGQAQMHAPGPHFLGAFPRSPSPLELSAGFSGRPPAIQGPPMPAPSNPSSFLPPSHPFQLRPSPQ
ncbi:hypothetical protein BS78_07G001300 [Paspalum vaginatum]|nr:hypothetical protein BS78_07G001300 [Paspalum vaginatum]